ERAAAVALREARGRKWQVADRQAELDEAKAAVKRAKDGKRNALSRLDAATARSSAEAGGSALSLKRKPEGVEAEVQRETTALKDLEDKAKKARAARDAANAEVVSLERSYQQAAAEIAQLEAKRKP